MHRTFEEQWQAAMRRGAFAEAWRLSDRALGERLARDGPQYMRPRHCQAIWDGSPLAGRRVLIRCYHGLGDTIQFIRFAAPLRRIASELTVWAQPGLVNLIATAAGVDRVLPLHEGEPEAAFDVDIESMELAHALRIRRSDLPGSIPYLHPAALPPRRGAAPTVGLIWSGGDWDRRRSLTLGVLAPLFACDALQFVSLQRGAAAADRCGLPIADTGSDDIDVFAARLAGLDLLVTIDTFAAHLAGALGVPTWLMLHSECDWRWMDRGDTSPWYPSLRLFRQRSAGDWRPVVADIAHALKQRSAERGANGRNKATSVTFAP